MEHVVVLVSGGVDSTILALEHPEYRRVFVNYGQHYAKEEEHACRELFGETFETVTLSGPRLGPESFVPNRNLTLASVVATFYAPDKIMVAGLRDDNVCDQSEAAHLQMSHALSAFSGKTIRVESPFWKDTKGEIVERFLQSHDASILQKTYSCFNGAPGGCQNCPACFRRFVALKSNGVDVPPVHHPIIQTYLAKLHTYNLDRVSRTLIALKSFAPIYAIDIDGVLCVDDARPYDQKIPQNQVIKKVNDLIGYRIIYTSRLESDRAVTTAWLDTHNIVYDAVLMGKVPFTVLLDDHSITPEEFFNVHRAKNI